MRLTIPRDYFSNPIAPSVFLCTQSGTKMGELQVYNTSLNSKWNAYSTFNFETNRTYVDMITGETKVHPLFDKIEGPRTVMVDNYGYFVIQDDNTIYSGQDTKSISAFSVEYNLSSRFVNSFHVNTGEIDSFEVMYEVDKYGESATADDMYRPAKESSYDPHVKYFHKVYKDSKNYDYEQIQIADENEYKIHFGEDISVENVLYIHGYANVEFYNKYDTELSLLHIILENISDWKIGHVDYELWHMERRISEERIDIYSLFTTKLANVFECVFEFDTLTKTINVYKEEEDGLTDDKVVVSRYDTDVYISRSNLASEVQISASTDNIKTRLKVGGSEDLDIREVNLGKNYIMNLDYYHSHKTDEYGNQIPDYEWMEQDLFEQYSKYEDAVTEYSPKYTEAMQNWVKAYNSWNDLVNAIPSNDGVLMIGDEFKKLYCTYTPINDAYMDTKLVDANINSYFYDLYIDPELTTLIDKTELDDGEAFIVQGYHFEYVRDTNNYKCIRNITTTTAVQSLYKKLNLYHVDEDVKANKVDNILLRLQNTDKDTATIRVYCKYIAVDSSDAWDKNLQYYVLKENRTDEYARTYFENENAYKKHMATAGHATVFTNVYYVKTDITRSALSATEASQLATLSDWVGGKLVIDSNSSPNLNNLKGFKITQIGTLGAYLCLAKQEVTLEDFTYSSEYLSTKNLIAKYCDQYNSLVNGNVDYAKRPLIYSKEMQAVWPEFDGDVATTYSQGYTIGKGENLYTIDITPIREDGIILSQKELDNYTLNLLVDNGIEGVLSSDKSKLIIHIQKGDYNKEYWDALYEQLDEIKNKHLEAVQKIMFDSHTYEPTPYLKSFGVRLLQEKQDTYMTIFQTQTEGMFSQEKYQCIVSDEQPAGNFADGTRWIDSDSSPVKLYIYNNGWGEVVSGVGMTPEDQASYENYQRYIDNFNKLKAVQEVLADKEREAQYWLDGYASNRRINLDDYQIKYVRASEYDRRQTYYDHEGNLLNPQPTSQADINAMDAYLLLEPAQSLEGDMERVALEHFASDATITRVSIDPSLPLYKFTTSVGSEGKFYNTRPSNYKKGDKWLVGADYAPPGIEIKYIAATYYIDGEIYYDVNGNQLDPQPTNSFEVRNQNCYVVIHHLLEAKSDNLTYADDDWGEITTYAVYLQGQTPYVSFSNSRGVYQAWMDYYRDLTELESFFDEDQWKRLSPLIRDDEFSDENFLLNGLESEEERLEVCQELMEAAVKELKTLSQPSLEFSMSMANILALPEFMPIIGQFALGNFIRIELREGLVKKARLLEVNLNFDELSDFSCLFGNLVSGKSEIDLHAELLSQAINAGKQVATSSGEWQKSVEKSNKLEEAINDGLANAALQVGRASGQAIEWNEHGFYCRKFKDGSTTEYEDQQIAIINNKLVFTDSNWETSRAALGEFQVDVNGDGIPETMYGLLADAVVSGFISGSRIEGGSLQIGGDGGKFIVHENGSVQILGPDDNAIYASPEDIYQYHTELVYTGSTVFSEPNSECIITAKVYSGETDITDKVLVQSGVKFEWSGGRPINGVWPTLVDGQKNVIKITNDNIGRDAQIMCSVTFDDEKIKGGGN